MYWLILVVKLGIVGLGALGEVFDPIILVSTKKNPIGLPFNNIFNF